MNQTIEAIMSRRPIRRYKPDPIPRDAINTIFEAGCKEPQSVFSLSGFNKKAICE